MEGDLPPCTLSHRLFVYEALMADPACHDWILRDIDRKWGHMLAQGATSFWETLEGAAAFDGAGSLCHGWSAAPAYVYQKLYGSLEKSAHGVLP